jgi:hypothetical protein
MQTGRTLLISLLLTASRAPGLAEDGSGEVTAPFRAWDLIVIHHSATSTGSAEAFDAGHRARGMTNGLAYHFVINNGTKLRADGELQIGPRWTKQLPGGHCYQESVNERAIGICLVGDFSVAQPTQKQMETLVRLVVQLQQQFGIAASHIVGHGDLAGEATECPGARFAWSRLREHVCEEAFPTVAVDASPHAVP